MNRTSTATARPRLAPPRRGAGQRALVEDKPVEVVIVGSGRVARALRSAVRRRGMACRHAREPEAAHAMVGEHTEAVVLVPPLPDESVLGFRAELGPAQLELPILVALPGSLAEPMLRRLYRGGVTGVFTWPAERSALLQTLARLVEMAPSAVDEDRSPADVALEEQAKLALDRAEAELGKHLHVVVANREATLIGWVDALWKLYAAAHALEELHGIEKVSTRGVATEVPSRPDAALERAVSETIEQSCDGRTIAVGVVRGRLTLSGSVGDRRELERLDRMVRQVRGVSEVDPLIVVSSEAKRRDREVARRVRKRLATEDGDVRAAVFGGICVLSGPVPSARRRRALNERVRATQGVDRIVDKLTVSKPRSR